MSAGYNTSGRNRILEFISENSARAVNVSEIHDALKEQGTDVNITTIYRYLEKLVSEGQVMKYDAQDGLRAVYQYVEQDHHCSEHLHLQCVKCGSIIHLDCHFMDELSEHVLMDHGFRIQCRNSIIYGLCEKCAGK